MGSIRIQPYLPMFKVILLAFAANYANDAIHSGALMHPTEHIGAWSIMASLVWAITQK